MDNGRLNALLTRFSYASERPSADCPALQVPPDKLVETCQALREELDFDFLMDVTAIDSGEAKSPRFTCVYHLYASAKKHYVRLAADCADDLRPTMPTLSKLWPGADWHERETYDMFGIVYEGHPDLRRILMWDDYPFFPLRKEFPLAGIETDLPAADVAETTKAKVLPAPMMGGPFAAPGDKARLSRSEPRAKDQSWTEVKPRPTE